MYQKDRADRKIFLQHDTTTGPLPDVCSERERMDGFIVYISEDQFCGPGING